MKYMYGYSNWTVYYNIEILTNDKGLKLIIEFVIAIWLNHFLAIPTKLRESNRAIILLKVLVDVQNKEGISYRADFTSMVDTQIRSVTR